VLADAILAAALLLLGVVAMRQAALRPPLVPPLARPG
jgi:hypothetical protein